ncbi:hypothetical protein [Microcoleus phage My-WqHQDG]|nr:hypothetical protein [Microcoleus phage My-WqHQDG]
MNPTMTREIMLGLMDYMRQGMAAYLIYMPELGMGALTPQQYQRRYMLTMREAVSYELGVSQVGTLSLNGYARYVPTGEDLQVHDTHLTLSVRCKWTAVGGPIGPFTHVILARGCNLYGGTAINGMNRGDYGGQVLLCQPQAKDSLGLTIQAGATYETSIPVRIAGRTMV